MKIKTAVIDLYNNEPNSAIKCIKDIISDEGLVPEVFDARFRNEIPGSEYDIFISTGGPGDPFDGEGSEWEKKYFSLLDFINSNNAKAGRKKYFFFICHSFQIMARYYQFADVTRRKDKSFGVIPFAKTNLGKNDILLKDLPDPFYARDSRSYQVINPNNKVLDELGAVIITTELTEGSEKENIIAKFPPAIMGVRISNEIAGTQFHPEADADSMILQLSQPERKQYIIQKYGEKGYTEMVENLKNPNAIELTRRTVLPSFLKYAIKELA